MKTYFPDEEVLYVDEFVSEDCHSGWKLFFDGAVNVKGVGIGAVLFLNQDNIILLQPNFDSTVPIIWQNTKLAFWD